METIITATPIATPTVAIFTPKDEAWLNSPFERHILFATKRGKDNDTVIIY